MSATVRRVSSVQRLEADTRHAVGAYLMLSSASIYCMLHRRHRMDWRTVVFAYTLVMLAVTTAWVAAGARWDAYYSVDMPYGTAPINTACTASQIVLKVTAMLQVLLSDGLLVRPPRYPLAAPSHDEVQIWRTYVIWGHGWHMIALPTLLYIVAVG